MKKTKYIMSGGTAFSEEKDLKKLSDYAKKGWVLDRFALFGYKLKKVEPQEIQYSMDFQPDADEEYFMYFEEAGWSHVCSVGNQIHIFSASMRIKPIYSDKATTIERYEREKKQMGKAALITLTISVVFLLFNLMSSYGWLPAVVGNISEILLIISIIILIFPGLPYLSYLHKLNKMRKS
ncbi:DUF2812 domain-containing protein [Priestia aryabhattai]|uniref:DUF2812 domain-containing protein n=1 Tax=Priestia aryabhattai TaxID=412384 RepID=UPI00398EDF26